MTPFAGCVKCDHISCPQTSAIERQTAPGISEAYVVVLVCNGQEGPTAADKDVIDWHCECGL